MRTSQIDYIDIVRPKACFHAKLFLVLRNGMSSGGQQEENTSSCD
jgi:hypothetical protein